MINKKDLIKEIKRQNRQNKKRGFEGFNFLGFVENDKLSDDVEGYFIVSESNYILYDWINGNESLKELIKKVLK